MSFIPISDKQVIGFFKKTGATVSTLFASRRMRIIAASAAAILLVSTGIAMRPRVSEAPIQGLVLEIEELGIVSKKTGLPHARVLIAVGDTTETSLLLPPPVPEIGHFIPLLADPSLFGEDGFRLDDEAWAAVGPS